MEQLLLILIISILNIVCFFIGAKLGQTVANGKEIKTPNLNPMELYKEHKEKEKIEQEQRKLEIIARNIERYNGTEAGQEDIE